MAESPAELGLRDYFEVLQRRKWIVIEVFVVLVATVAIGSLLQAPVYRATAALLVETQAPSPGRREELPLVALAMEVTRSRTIETHKQLITRRPVLEATIADLDYPLIVEKLRRQISVETFRDTDVVEIHADNNDPEIATKVANSLADNYILLNQEYNRASAESASRFLEEQLATVKEQVTDAEEKIESYKRSTGISDLDQETRQRIAGLEELAGKLAVAEAEAQAAAAESRVIEEQLAEEEPFGLRASSQQSNPVARELETELARLEAERAGLLAEYAPQSSPMRVVDAQIAKLKQQLAHQLEMILASTTQGANPVRDELLTHAARSKAAVAAARNRVTALEQALRRGEAQLGKIPSRQKELAQLMRTGKVAERVYTLLLEKYHEVRVAEAMSLSNARLVEPAVVPQFPIKPRYKLNIALACVFGLILGIMLASLVEYLDNTIKDPKEISEVLGVPVLGIVPRFRKEEGELVTEQGHRSRVTEAFRTLRSNLGFVSVEQPARTLAITSAGTAEGKTFVAANLGITLAQEGKKVILVDSDLRRPSIHKLFDVDNTEGLTNVLVGGRELGEVLKSCQVEGLEILPSGPIPPNPVELLASDRMGQVCEELADRADIVLFDLPPALIVADAATLASRVDGSILVVEQGGPSRKLVAETRDLLVRAHSRIVGAVLNKMSKQAGSYYYYYYYSDYYSSEEE